MRSIPVRASGLRRFAGHGLASAQWTCEHFQMKHLQIFIYSCPENRCGKGYRNTTALDNHINAAHVKENFHCKNTSLGCKY